MEDEAKNEVESTDKELKAISDVLSALENLQKEARDRVLSYVFARLGLQGVPASAATQPTNPSLGQPAVHSQGALAPTAPLTDSRITDIRSMKDQKKPRNSVEMAVLLAYFLLHNPNVEERKDSIGTAEVEKYFIQAGFPLPVKPGNTLAHAKNAGYLELTDRGSYRLNAVGHNLVVHSLPSDSTEGQPRRSKREKLRKPSQKKHR